MRRNGIGLALAGGGPLGVTYEIGVLNALAASLSGIDFNDLTVYVGVFAGSVLAAGLANGITPRDICRLFIEGEPAEGGLEAFDPAILLPPARREYLRRLREVPRVATGSHRALLPGGLPMVLSQTFRALIHSRMQASFARYAHEFRGLDIVVFEPDRSDTELFFTNLFSYASRRRVCEHAYQRTRADLWARRASLGPILARHGVTLKLDVREDNTRTLVPGPPLRMRPAPPVVWALETALRKLKEWLAEQSVTATA